MKKYYVYIMSNKCHTVYYTGFTNDLVRRIYEHKQKYVEGFTKKYRINELLYFEIFDKPEEAIIREKQIKDYRREKKLDLIKKQNPKMRDLYLEILV